VSCLIAEIAATRRPVRFDRYAELHDDGRALIQGWLERATRSGARAEDFASFIYLWIAFNGWAACVTGKDADWAWNRALIADPDLNDRFAELVADPSTRTSAAALRFSELWPIFRVAELRERGIDSWASEQQERAAMAAGYVEAGARKFEPRCYVTHQGQPPVDWGHTLAALYRVRCNLFHGEKARSSENDQTVVAAAYSTLLACVEESALLR
jgi:hypothetical protein